MDFALSLSPGRGERGLLPDVTWIVWDTVVIQKCDQFFLKRNLSVMLLLVRDVLTHFFSVRVADTERRVTRLPGEFRVQHALFVNPTR